MKSNIGNRRIKNSDADSAESMRAASANEAAGLMYKPALGEAEAEAAEELFPLEAPQTGETEPAKDPTPGEGERKHGTVRPIGDEPLPDIRTLEDTEFGTLGAREPSGFFSRMGRLDPADSFVPVD